jgi:hypothetical protein
MSYVDLIIKYLSGDLSLEDSRSFEKELESNDELRQSFEEHSAAFELIRNQLQKSDLEAFKAKLEEAVSHDAPHKIPGKAGRRLWYLPPAIACFLALMLIIFLSRPGNERVFARFHHPEEDPIVQGYYQQTRGVSEPGITQYRQGNYARAMDLLMLSLSEERDNKFVLLYCLLAAIELDQQEEVLELVRLKDTESMDLLDQSLSWYSTLGLIKSGRQEAALKMLHPLSEHEGPYQSDAIKLEKVLLK